MDITEASLRRTLGRVLPGGAADVPRDGRLAEFGLDSHEHFRIRRGRSPITPRRKKSR